jgi:hypothetical protein
METNASTPLSHAELVQNHHLRQLNQAWLSRARAVQHESRGLRQHSHELRTRCQQWSQRYLRVTCAWCQKLIRWQSMPAPVPMPMTSHGICPTCYATVMHELDLMNGGYTVCSYSDAFPPCSRLIPSN